MRRRALGATLVAGLTLAVAAPALAHVELLGTTPKSGTTVAHLPTTIKLNFGEPPIRLVGVTVTRAGANHVVRARLNPKNAKQVLVTTRNDRTGRYLSKWTVIAPDGDKQVGTFSFRVKR